MILANRESHWAEENNLLHKCQFGFKPGRSTTDAVATNLVQKKCVVRVNHLFIVVL